MMSAIPSYDRKKGQQHNLAMVELYLGFLEKNRKVDMTGYWHIYWCDMLLFDALIGNTDRHQDNWGLLWRTSNEIDKVRMAPVFDNGTSLGYEILERNMDDFYKPDRMRNYINKGRHHIRWRLYDEYPAQHIKLLEFLAKRHSVIANRIINKLNAFDMEGLRAIITDCTKYNILIPLTEKRAEFVCHLIESRYLTIKEQIEKHL